MRKLIIYKTLRSQYTIFYIWFVWYEFQVTRIVDSWIWNRNVGSKFFLTQNFNQTRRPSDLWITFFLFSNFILIIFMRRTHQLYMLYTHKLFFISPRTQCTNIEHEKVLYTRRVKFFLINLIRFLKICHCFFFLLFVEHEKKSHMHTPPPPSTSLSWSAPAPGRCTRRENTHYIESAENMCVSVWVDSSPMLFQSSQTTQIEKFVIKIVFHSNTLTYTYIHMHSLGMCPMKMEYV